MDFTTGLIYGEYCQYQTTGVEDVEEKIFWVGVCMFDTLYEPSYRMHAYTCIGQSFLL